MVGWLISVLASLGLVSWPVLSVVPLGPGPPALLLLSLSGLGAASRGVFSSPSYLLVLTSFLFLFKVIAAWKVSEVYAPHDII
jgi:hypothetical protein